MTPAPTYDVFLSYNSADLAAVESIAQKLRAAGLNPFFAPWQLVAGEPWQEALERGLDESQTCAVFLGPRDLGPWENEEMRSALDAHTRTPSFRVIPVLLPGANMPESKRLPRFLARLTWVDFRGGLEDPQALHRLVSGIAGVPPGPGSPPLATGGTKPGKGRRGWENLFGHPLFWIACGAVPVLLLAVLFSTALRCMLEYRLTEATVALFVLLGAGAAGAFRLAPEKRRTRLQLLYASFSIALLLVVVLFKGMPPPAQTDCYPALVAQATPSPGIPETPTTAPTQPPGEAGLITQTPALVCAVAHPAIAGISVPGTLTLVEPAWGADCVTVDKQQAFTVRWEGIPSSTYRLWVLVYSPVIQKYYPRPCGTERLPASGERACQAGFSKPEPYEIVLLLADAQADQELQKLSAGASQEDLPGGVAEKAAHRVIRK